MPTLPCYAWPPEASRPLGDHEVSLTQYLRPSGFPAPVAALVGVDLAQRAKAAGLHLSTELLATGDVVLYARRPDQDPEEELCDTASNGPGPNEPGAVLSRLIERVLQGA